MKSTIIYIISFALVFVLVTAGIIFMNSKYQNIFAFDFSPVHTVQPVQIKKNPDGSIDLESLRSFFEKDIKDEIIDSIRSNYSKKAKVDTVYQEVVKDTSLIDSLNNLKKALIAIKKEEAAKADTLKQVETTPKKSNSGQWAKQTAKLFESMDPRKAAKVIQKYSDNEAREVIFKMNRKKAAQILSQLDPNFVQRITKPQS